MEQNAEDETQSIMQKAQNTREKFWHSSLASCLIYPNDPPRALFISRKDGYSIFRRATRGKMVEKPKIACKLHRKAQNLYFFAIFRVHTGFYV